MIACDKMKLWRWISQQKQKQYYLEKNGTISEPIENEAPHSSFLHICMSAAQSLPMEREICDDFNEFQCTMSRTGSEKELKQRKNNQTWTMQIATKEEWSQQRRRQSRRKRWSAIGENLHEGSKGNVRTKFVVNSSKSSRDQLSNCTHNACSSNPSVNTQVLLPYPLHQLWR